MTNRLTLVAAAALLSLIATPLVVRAGAGSPQSEPAAALAETTVAAEAPAPAPAPACRTVRVVYAGYGAPACAR
jgi:hypothetical protein